jgi:hypothetical protein
VGSNPTPISSFFVLSRDSQIIALGLEIPCLYTDSAGEFLVFPFCIESDQSFNIIRTRNFNVFVNTAQGAQPLMAGRRTSLKSSRLLTLSLRASQEEFTPTLAHLKNLVESS